MLAVELCDVELRRLNMAASTWTVWLISSLRRRRMEKTSSFSLRRSEKAEKMQPTSRMMTSPRSLEVAHHFILSSSPPSLSARWRGE